MISESNTVTELFIFKSDSAFADLPDKVKDAFFNLMNLKHIKKGQNIFVEGSYPAGIFFIKKGKVKKYKSLDGGKEQIIYVCNEGELLGYAAFLSEERYPDSAASLTEAAIGFISKEHLLQLLDKHDEM